MFCAFRDSVNTELHQDLLLLGSVANILHFILYTNKKIYAIIVHVDEFFLSAQLSLL